MTTVYRADDYDIPTGSAGECWTEDLDVAERYGQRVYTLLADLTGSVEVDGYDHATDTTPADDTAFLAAHAADGAIWIDYEDEDEMGRESRTYRLVADISADITTV